MFKSHSIWLIHQCESRMILDSFRRVFSHIRLIVQNTLNSINPSAWITYTNSWLIQSLGSRMALLLWCHTKFDFCNWINKHLICACVCIAMAFTNISRSLRVTIGHFCTMPACYWSNYFLNVNSLSWKPENKLKYINPVQDESCKNGTYVHPRNATSFQKHWCKYALQVTV